MSLEDVQKVYEDNARKIKELGDLILVTGIFHENYTKESLEEMKRRRMTGKGEEARKRLGKALKESEDIIKYLKKQYP